MNEKFKKMLNLLKQRKLEAKEAIKRIIIKHKKDCITIKGKIEIETIDAKTGKILDVKTFTNLITNNGLKMHRNWAATISQIQDANYNVDTHITHIAVGNNNSTPAVSQTALGNELLRKELYPTPDAGCSRKRFICFIKNPASSIVHIYCFTRAV